MRIAPEIYRFADRADGIPSPGPIRLVCPECGDWAHVRIGLRNALRRAITTGASARASGCGICPRCALEFGVSVQVDADHLLPGTPPRLEWDEDL